MFKGKKFNPKNLRNFGATIFASLSIGVVCAGSLHYVGLTKEGHRPSFWFIPALFLAAVLIYQMACKLEVTK